MNTIHAVIRVNKQDYDVYGLERVDPMAGHADGLFFYFQDRMDGRYTQATRHAKIVSIAICDLGNEYITAETKQALGFSRL